jgi:hypothetical protein
VKVLTFVNTVRGITAGLRAAKYATNRILVAARVLRRTVHRLTVRSQPRNRHRSRRRRRSSARSSSAADGDPPGDVARYGRVGGSALAEVDQLNSVELDRIYTALVADLRSRSPEAVSPMNFGPPTEPIRDLREPRGGR